MVTTLGRSVPALEHLVVKYGYERLCKRVRACEVPVLDLEDESSDSHQRGPSVMPPPVREAASAPAQTVRVSQPELKAPASDGGGGKNLALVVLAFLALIVLSALFALFAL